MKNIFLLLFLSYSIVGNSQTVDELVAKAKNEYESGNYSKSIELLDIAIKKDKRNADAYCGCLFWKSEL